MSATAPAPALVLGRYRPLRPLGSGGSGSVWLARDVEHGRDVALKIVPRQGNAGSRARREAEAASRLRHESCLRAHALARDDDHVYIAYEYVPGRTLRDVLRAGELDDGQALEVAAQLLDALAHAHAQGIVHRDVKPANVLLRDGPGIRVKLFDFGLAVLGEDEETLTAAGDIPGTLAYTSPERLRGRPAGPPADVWAVGVILWEALAGRHPFGGGTVLDTARRIRRGAPSLREERPDLPAAVVECVHRALAPDPERRPDARTLATQLRRAATRRAHRAARPRRLALPRPARILPAPPRLAHAAGAGLFVGWTTATFPFFPAGWPSLLAALAAGLALLRERAALALALAAPLLPLGNHALALALLYGAAAALWLAVFWSAPRSGLLFVLGPLLVPAACLGLLPLALTPVVGFLRRALLAAAGVLAAAAVAAAGRLAELGLASSERPAEAASGLAVVVAARPELALQAGALGLAAAALPWIRGRGAGPVLVYGAAVLAALLAATGGDPALLPVALGLAATCVLLLVEARLRPRPAPPGAAAASAVLPLRPARGVCSRG